jgi:hypothetical protein
MMALRALLAGIVDYAGLFPPAALDMASAVRNYADYRSDSEAWMLGRFVVPVSRLEEFLAERRGVTPADNEPWKLAALLGSDPVRDVAVAREFNRRQADLATIDSLEGMLSTADDIQRVTSAARPDLEVFAELPNSIEPSPLVAAIRRAGARGKIRTGGVTQAAIPPAATVVRFIRCCIDAGIAFKATAGLHHPIRAEYRLTYDEGSPTGTMYGYLNVFLAAALMSVGSSDEDALRVLEERDVGAFEISADGIAWRGHSVSAGVLETVRDGIAVSFGSCSFREPVDELRTLLAR